METRSPNPKLKTPNPTPIALSSAIHKLQLSLIESPSTPLPLLIAASSLLSKPDYSDVVTERTISHLCGYPPCPNLLPPPSSRHRKGKYRVSLRDHKVYDLQETYNYCCDDCVIGSGAVREGLSNERRADVDVSRDKVEEVLKVFGFLNGGEKKKNGEGLGVRELKIKEKEDVGVKMDEWIGPSNAIDGYVPKFDQGSISTSSLEFFRGNCSANSNGVECMSTTVFGDENDGAAPNGSSQLTNISEILAKELENMVISEKKKTTAKKSSKSLKPKTQTEAIKNKIELVDSGDAGFTSSIIFGNEFDSGLPNNCSLTTRDTSEQIAKQLEDVIAEKKVTKVKISKAPKAKPRKKKSNNKSDRIDFESSIIIGDLASPGTNLPSLDYSTKPAISAEHNQLEDKISLEGAPLKKKEVSEGAHLKKKEVLEETRLKSSLKTSGTERRNQTVKWADERKCEDVEGNKDSAQVMNEENSESSLRLASAEACAAALSQAAEAVASGEIEAGDAVSEAGIVILPQPLHEEGESEAVEEAFDFDQEVVKWPKKTVLLDTDMFNVEDSWHDTPPEGFSLTLSSFATMWMALFGWITCSSLAYIYGHDESSHEDFLIVNSREYPRKIVLRDGKSSEIRQALDGFVCRALPGLVMDLRLRTPVSTLEKFVGDLLNTMSFVDALPSFRTKQWQVFVLLFIEALSVHRLPSLAPQMTSRSMLLHKPQQVLSAAQVSSEEYAAMRDLIIPLGQFPEFSMQIGGIMGRTTSRGKRRQPSSMADKSTMATDECPLTLIPSCSAPYEN